MKTVLWIIAIPLSLVILLVLLLQVPGIQRFATSQAGAYVSKKTGTTVRLGKLGLRFPKAVSLEDLYVEDLDKDTLLYVKGLDVDIALLDLLDRQVTVNKVSLHTLTARISRPAGDTSFNFNFIIEAFSKPGQSTDQTKPTDSISKPWGLHIGNVELEHIRASYHDAYTGSFADLKLGRLSVEVKTLDLEKKLIDVDHIDLADTYASYLQKVSHAAGGTSEPGKPFDYILKLGQLNLDRIQASYHNTVLNQQAALSLGHLVLKPEAIDLAHEQISVKSLTLSRTNAKYVMGFPSDSTPIRVSAPDSAASPSSNWVVKVKQLALDSNHFYYDDNRKPKASAGMDYHHLAAANFCLHANNVYGNAKASHMDLQQLSFREQCGFELKSFRGKLVYDTVHIEASDLYIETGGSVIRNRLAIRYPSLAGIGKDIGRLYASVQLKDSYVKAGDVLYFAPMLADIAAIQLTPETRVKLDVDAQGLINDLQIKRFDLFTPKQTILKLKGSLRQVMSPERLYADLQDIHLTSTRQDLLTILNPKLIPSSVEIPETFALTGRLKGYLKNFNTNLSVQTSMGNILADIRMNPAAGNVEQPYEGTIEVEHVNVGKLIRQQGALGEISTSLRFKGSGLSPENLNAEIDLDLKKAHVKGYDYSRLQVKGQLVKKSFTGKAHMDDPNLAFDFDGSVRFDSAAPKFVFNFDLKGADLKALKLSPEDLRIKTQIRSDLQQQGDNITGSARIDHTLLVKNNKRIPVDSIMLASNMSNGISEVTLRSDILQAELKGKLHMTELVASLRQLISSYYQLDGAAHTGRLQEQDVDYRIIISHPEFISDNFVPALREISPFSITGSYNNIQRKLVADMSLPHIQYNNTKADSLRLRILGGANALTFSFHTAEISDPTLKVENASLSGEAQNNKLTFRLQTAKDDSLKLLALEGTLQKGMSGGHELRLEPALTLNAQSWTVNSGNLLRFLPQGLMVKDFHLSNGSQSIRVNSLGDSPEAPLQLDFDHFELSSVSTMFENQKELLKGQVNGSLKIEKRGQSNAFSSDLEISQVVFQSVPVGTVKLKANNYAQAEVYHIELNVEGNGNALDVSGTYALNNPKEALNLVLDIRSLQLKTIEPFTFGQVTRLSGNAEGRLAIKGSAGAPALNGHIRFRETTLNPKFIDSYLKIPDATLGFSNQQLVLNGFTVLDSLDQKAVLDGKVFLKDLKNPGLDIRLRSDNFLALNTTKQDNPLYFGTIFLDSDIKIKGSVNAPQVKARIRLNKGSEITYVKPESQVGKAENKGIVEFVDSVYTNKNIMTRQTDTLNDVTMVKGIDLDASITFDKTVQLKMLVDPQSGDSLYIVGGGTLNFILDQSGKTTLTGKYRIDDGGYHLTISEVVKRDFRIEPGSSVTWSGDLLDAYIDIKAIYTIKTSPIDLIQNDLAGVDELERNKYRNMLTFLVYLKMNGFLSAPEISFDIQLAPKDRGAVNGTVNAKLEELRGDETQLNKQVFALLTLRRFISDNPLDNGGGGGLSSASRTSASKILTQQLSSLSQKYVKSVDLDLGVNSFEDYSTGQEQGRTQLQIGVSKQLFKDKVTIRVGGNVELEGERAKQNNASDVAGNISIDYKLTEDGRYKLRGFRQNQYENPIEGEITKTGVGVVYVRNYNRLKELFKKPKRTQTPANTKTK